MYRDREPVINLFYMIFVSYSDDCLVLENSLRLDHS